MVKYSSSGGQAFPLLNGYGLKTCSVQDPAGAQLAATINNNRWFNRLFVPAGTPITNLWVAVKTGGTHDGVTAGNQIALFTDAGVKVDTLAEDPTLWGTAGWRGGALPLGQVPAQGADRFVYLVWTIHGFAAVNPVIMYPSNAADADSVYITGGPGGTTNRRAAYDSTATIPASFTPATIGTSTGFISLCGTS